MTERNTQGMTARKQHFLQHKGNHSNNKKAYTDRSMSTGRKVGFAAVFVDIARRGGLPKEASIHTAEMTAIKIAMREIRKREDMRWVMYTDSLSSMLAIENNKENHTILNQMYDILAELHNKGKQIILCKVPAHIGIKGNEEADKAAKQAIDMPGITTTRLPYTDYYLTIRRARNSRMTGNLPEEN